MARIVIYDEANNRVLEDIKSANTPDYDGRTDVLINPTVPQGIPIKYLKVSGSSLKEMNPSEKNQVDSEETQAEFDRINSLDDGLVLDRSSIKLTKVDNAIDNIGNLNDAKNFLKKLCRYILSITT